MLLYVSMGSKVMEYHPENQQSNDLHRFNLFRRLVFSSLLAIVLLFGVSHAEVHDVVIPEPLGLKHSITPSDSPEYILQAFLGIPYRINGAVDEKGNYTLFPQPDELIKRPGLNCSGFILSASRFLLGKNISLSAAMRDRLKDSEANSIHGQDWDFGWDLILNIAEGFNATFILPEGKSLDSHDLTVTGFSPRGYDLHARETWPELSNRLKPGFLYLVSFNKDTVQKGYKMQHYHVALIHVNERKEIWLYQTTGRSNKVYRRNLSNQKQRELFLSSFANTGKIRKYILILEIALP